MAIKCVQHELLFLLWILWYYYYELKYGYLKVTIIDCSHEITFVFSMFFFTNIIFTDYSKVVLYTHFQQYLWKACKIVFFNTCNLFISLFHTSMCIKCAKISSSQPQGRILSTLVFLLYGLDILVQPRIKECFLHFGLFHWISSYF